MLDLKSIDLGLTEKEIAVFSAIIELQSATASELSRKSGVNRSTTYVILSSLESKKYVSSLNKMGVRKYEACRPEALLGWVGLKLKKYENIRNNLERILPELYAVHKDTKNRPKVLVYEGEKAVKNSYLESSFNFKDNIRGFEDPSILNRKIPGYIESDCEKRKKRGVNLFTINPDTKINRELDKIYRSMHPGDRNIFIPNKYFKFKNNPIDFSVYGDELTFASFNDAFVVVIKHAAIAETIKNIFNLAWKEAERLSKTKKRRAR